jgi:twitching motility two-component system response regulator PilG
MSPVVDALKDIVKQKLSGKLTIRDNQDSSVSWEVFFGEGKLHFATSTIGQRERLAYLIKQFHPNFSISEIHLGESDYQFICDRWQSGKLSLQQVRQLAFSSTQEAFIHIMAIGDAEMDFNLDIHLEPMVLSVSVQRAISPVKQMIWQAQSIRSLINSPLSRLYLIDLDSLYQLLWQEFQNTKVIAAYKSALSQNLCIYSIAEGLDTNTIELSRKLLPLVKSKALQVSSYGTDRHQARPLIACVDDSPTIQESVQLMLNPHGYDVLSIIQPARATVELVRFRPMLILMDINMPDIDGYKLCQLLRKSVHLKQTPIIMLTSRDGFFDRMKAKMVGADQYLTKPFNSQQLLDAVNQQISKALLLSSPEDVYSVVKN